KVGIGQSGLFAVAIGFDQTGLIGPVVQRIAQGSPQRRILAQIQHEESISPRRDRTTEKRAVNQPVTHRERSTLDRKDFTCPLSTRPRGGSYRYFHSRA